MAGLGFLSILIYALTVFPFLIVLMLKKRAAWIILMVEAGLGTLVCLYLGVLFLGFLGAGGGDALAVVPLFLAPIFLLIVAIYGFMQWKAKVKNISSMQNRSSELLDDMMPPAIYVDSPSIGFIPMDFNRDKLGILSIPIFIVLCAVYFIFRTPSTLLDFNFFSMYLTLYTIVWITFLWAKRRTSGWALLIVYSIYYFIAQYLQISDMMAFYGSFGAGGLGSEIYLSTLLPAGVLAIGGVLISVFAIRKWNASSAQAEDAMI